MFVGETQNTTTTNKKQPPNKPNNQKTPNPNQQSIALYSKVKPVKQKDCPPN